MKSYYKKNTFGIHFFIILVTKWSVSMMKFVQKCLRISSSIDELGCWCLQYKFGGAGHCSSIREEIVSMVNL